MNPYAPREVTIYNQKQYSIDFDIDIILVPIGSRVEGSIEDMKVTIRDDQDRIRFQCEYNDYGQRHGTCHAWQPYGGGCDSIYENGECTGYSY